MRNSNIKIRFQNISDDGFTLLELIMVIVIVGILSSVAVPKFINLSEFCQWCKMFIQSWSHCLRHGDDLLCCAD